MIHWLRHNKGVLLTVTGVGLLTAALGGIYVMLAAAEEAPGTDGALEFKDLLETVGLVELFPMAVFSSLVVGPFFWVTGLMINYDDWLMRPSANDTPDDAAGQSDQSTAH